VTGKKRFEEGKESTIQTIENKQSWIKHHD